MRKLQNPVKIQDPVLKAFSPRLFPSCCSVGITNSKMYIDCSLYGRPQTHILQPPKRRTRGGQHGPLQLSARPARGEEDRLAPWD